MKLRKIKIAVSWIAVAAVMIMIFHFSSQPAELSTTTSGGVIEFICNIYARIKGIPCSTLDVETLETLQHPVRKTAHFSIYLFLGIAASNAFLQSGVKKLGKIGVFAFLLSVCYALTDEFHQLFVEGRSGELKDVCIDSSGALVGIFIFMLIYRMGCKIWTLKKH